MDQSLKLLLDLFSVLLVSSPIAAKSFFTAIARMGALGLY
jgi:hypothetical protein